MFSDKHEKIALKTRDEDGKTPQMLACNHGHKDVVKFYI